MTNEDCPFCKMFEHKIDEILVIDPLNPVAEGHKLVIPKKHVTDFADDPDISSRVMRHASQFAKKHGGDYNLITSKGKHATQTVFHLHVHLIPRHDGDGLLLPWSLQRVKHGE